MKHRHSSCIHLPELPSPAVSVGWQRGSRRENVPQWWRAAAATIAFALLAVFGSGCGSSNSRPTHAASTSASSLAPIHGTYSPSIDPANFVAAVDNRYWPLKPGTRFHYQGMRGKNPQTDDELLTHHPKPILGLSCTVVRDTVSEHGRAIERTPDWYAQDKQ